MSQVVLFAPAENAAEAMEMENEKCKMEIARSRSKAMVQDLRIQFDLMRFCLIDTTLWGG